MLVITSDGSEHLSYQIAETSRVHRNLLLMANLVILL